MQFAHSFLILKKLAICCMISFYFKKLDTSLASSNMGLFDTVVEDMLNRNASGDKEGVSLLKIMRDNDFSTDLYWTSPVFDEYKKLLDDIKNSHEKFREL